MLTAFDVLKEYRQYIKIITRKVGRDKDVEKAEIIVAALEKQIKTPPIDKTLEYDGEYGKCPCCNTVVTDYDDMYVCSHCGQALDWSDT